MIRLTRQTDYGIVLLTRFAAEPESTSHNARELSAGSHLPPPMVSKILKALVRAGLLVSQRGVKGGYHLARRPEDITVNQIIRALEGPIAMTECSPGDGHCVNDKRCAVKSNWQLINQAVTVALDSLTLADMARPIEQEALLTLSRRPTRRSPPVDSGTKMENVTR